MERLQKAENGKVFKRKSDGRVLDYLLLLAKTDSIDNYEQIDKPIEETEND